MSLWYYAQVIFVLLIILGVLFFALKFSKFVQKKKYSGEIQEIDRLAVDNGVTLFVIKVGEQKYFLSVGGKEVKLLEKL
jgi:flagellar biogenesis protein FliO